MTKTVCLVCADFFTQTHRPSSAHTQKIATIRGSNFKKSLFFNLLLLRKNQKKKKTLDLDLAQRCQEDELHYFSRLNLSRLSKDSPKITMNHLDGTDYQRRPYKWVVERWISHAQHFRLLVMMMMMMSIPSGSVYSMCCIWSRIFAVNITKWAASSRRGQSDRSRQ